jgi:hypothetical protein
MNNNVPNSLHSNNPGSLRRSINNYEFPNIPQSVEEEDSLRRSNNNYQFHNIPQIVEEEEEEEEEEEPFLEMEDVEMFENTEEQPFIFEENLFEENLFEFEQLFEENLNQPNNNEEEQNNIISILNVDEETEVNYKITNTEDGKEICEILD